MIMSKQFNIKVFLEDTRERFPVNKVTNQTTLDSLKIDLEVIAGIPKDVQRLMYLDQGDMEDHSILKHHDVVPGGQLTMRMWRSWAPLIRACAKGEVSKVMKLGVTRDSDYRDPNTSFMSEAKRIEWFQERAFVALFIAAHRGHGQLMKALINAGADVQAATKHGRTALHVAAARGQDECVDILLAHGAGNLIHTEDKLGKTPLNLAAEWSHKSSERRLFLFQWRVRASTLRPTPSSKDLMAHQIFDSAITPWLKGTTSQLYCSNVLPPQEFEGTRLDAKPSKHYHGSHTTLTQPNSVAKARKNLIKNR